MMKTLPEEIINKINLFISHPIADIVKESPYFTYLRLMKQVERPYTNNDFELIFFNFGRYMGWRGMYDCNDLVDRVSTAMFSERYNNCLKYYNLGAIYTKKGERGLDTNQNKLHYEYLCIPEEPWTHDTYYVEDEYICERGDNTINLMYKKQKLLFENTM